jgi:hypothetical protein
MTTVSDPSEVFSVNGIRNLARGHLCGQFFPWLAASHAALVLVDFLVRGFAASAPGVDSSRHSWGRSFPQRLRSTVSERFYRR